MVLSEEESWGWDTIIPSLVIAFVLGELVVLIFIRGAGGASQDQEEAVKSKVRRRHRQ